MKLFLLFISLTFLYAPMAGTASLNHAQGSACTSIVQNDIPPFKPVPNQSASTEIPESDTDLDEYIFVEHESSDVESSESTDSDESYGSIVGKYSELAGEFCPAISLLRNVSHEIDSDMPNDTAQNLRNRYNKHLANIQQIMSRLANMQKRMSRLGQRLDSDTTASDRGMLDLARHIERITKGTNFLDLGTRCTKAQEKEAEQEKSRQPLSKTTLEELDNTAPVDCNVDSIDKEIKQEIAWAREHHGNKKNSAALNEEMDKWIEYLQGIQSDIHGNKYLDQEKEKERQDEIYKKEEEFLTMRKAVHNGLKSIKKLHADLNKVNQLNEVTQIDTEQRFITGESTFACILDLVNPKSTNHRFRLVHTWNYIMQLQSYFHDLNVNLALNRNPATLLHDFESNTPVESGEIIFALQTRMLMLLGNWNGTESYLKGEELNELSKMTAAILNKHHNDENMTSCNQVIDILKKLL